MRQPWLKIYMCIVFQFPTFTQEHKNNFTTQHLINADRVIRVQFRSVAENLVCKSVQL